MRAVSPLRLASPQSPLQTADRDTHTVRLVRSTTLSIHGAQCVASTMVLRTAGLGVGHSRRLDRSQVKHERTGILAAEVKSGHVGVPNHEPLPQAVNEPVEIQPAIELVKRRCADVRTGAAYSDRVTLRAHSFGKRSAPLLQRARRAFGCPYRAHCKEHKQEWRRFAEKARSFRAKPQKPRRLWLPR
jgi:hypothetical protein